MQFAPKVAKLRDDTSDDEDTEEPSFGNPFYSEVQQVMRYVFGGMLKPTTLEGQQMILPWVDLYKQRQAAFVIRGSFHQNGVSDQLHLSVAYKAYLAPEVRFHIYGFWKTQFIVDRITMQAGSRVIELASYAREK